MGVGGPQGPRLLKTSSPPLYEENEREGLFEEGEIEVVVRDGRRRVRVGSR